MMSDYRRHVGFRQEVPEEVAWSDLSFVVPVHQVDRRDCKGTHKFVSISLYSFLALSVLLFFGGKYLARHFGFSGMIPITVAGVMFLVTLGFGYLQGYVLKGMLAGRLRNRSESLFEPDRESIFIAIEDPFTYEKNKLTAEDYGLLNIMPGLIQLEMCAHRAQFSSEELAISLVYAHKNAVGVRLISKNELYPWSVVLTPAGMSRNIFEEANGKKKGQRLFDRLMEAGFSNAKSSVPVRPEPVQNAVAVLPNEEGLSCAGYVNVEPVEAIENADLLENRYQAILQEIRNKEKSRKGWLKSIAILIISLLIFLQLGYVRWGLELVAVIFVVLLVHEMGHFLGMKIFGYKNVQMFFIPLMGAAVSGRSRNVAAWKKAIVMLLGPLPGISIALVLAIIGLFTEGNTLIRLAGIFLVLNLLNLLPIFPLDGGRFLHEVLFSRSRYVELVMNILATAVLLIAGFGLNDWVLRILGFLNLVTISHKFRLASAALKMRAELLQKNKSLLDQSGEEDIPENVLKLMIVWIQQNIPGSLKPKAFATMTLDLWDRIRILPPRVGATIGLLTLYFSGYVISLVAFGILGFSYWKENRYKSEIVSFVDPNGMVCNVEKTYLRGKVFSEAQLTEDQKYYHGRYKEYDSLGFVEEGLWENGQKVGKWISRDPNGVTKTETYYEKGRPILFRTLIGDQWEETKWEDLSQEDKDLYIEIAENRSGPETSD